jgi:uncharacterized protein YkwD
MLPEELSSMERGAVRRWVESISLVVVAFWAVACGGSGNGASPTASGGSLTADDVEFRSLQLTNEARSSERVEPQFGFDPEVAAVARSHSAAMRDEGFFGHIDPQGNGLRHRLDAAGIRYSGAAENLVQVHHATRPAEIAHGQLMGSASHRHNILSPDYRLAGVGVARAGNTYWITQIFLLP